MKIYSDTLTQRDLQEALPHGVSMSIQRIPKARTRANGWNVYLEGHAPRHTRKVNSGEYGAGYHYAATYDDHGYWMAQLFDLDPDAVISWWDGREKFHTGTNGAYSTAVPA